MFKCTQCGEVYPVQKRNFLTTSSPLYAANNGYLSVCKTCVEKHYLLLVELYNGNENKALESCCQLFDWYYRRDIAAMTKTEEGTRVIYYPSKAQMIQLKAKGKTYLDTVKERIANGETFGDCEVTYDVIKFFGPGYKDEDYEFLAEQYNDWTSRYECLTKAQEEIFKAICVNQLVMIRAQRAGNTKDVVDTTKAFQSLLETAGLKPNQEDHNKEQRTFGEWIKKIEETRPIPEPAEEWKDVDGIKNYIETWFLGHMCELLHIPNDKREKYRAELAKYTVTPPTHDGFEDVIDTSILDKFKNRETDDAADS